MGAIRLVRSRHPRQDSHHSWLLQCVSAAVARAPSGHALQAPAPRCSHHLWLQLV